MAITADIALLSPAIHNAVPASPGAGMAFAAVLGQIAVVRGAQSKRDPGPVPNTLAPNDHAETPATAQGNVSQKTDIAAAPNATALSPFAGVPPTLQAVAHNVLLASSSTIQPSMTPSASQVFTLSSALSSVLGTVAAPSNVQPSRKDNLTTTTGLATIAQPEANSPAPLLSTHSSPLSLTTLPSAMFVNVVTRQTAKTTNHPGDATASQPIMVLAPHLAATVQPLNVAPPLASMTPSIAQAQPSLAAQLAMTIRPVAETATRPQGNLSDPLEPGAYGSVPITRKVSATVSTVTTPKTTKPLNGAAAPQAQTLLVQPLAILPLATVAIEPNQRIAATATAVPLSPHQNAAVQTGPLASGTIHTDVPRDVDAPALPTPVAGPAAHPDPVSPGNTAGASSRRLPALPAVTRDPPSQTIRVPAPSAPAPPNDILAARPIATPEAQLIGQRVSRQAATGALIQAAGISAARPAAANIAAPQPAPTVLTLSDAPQVAVVLVNASSEAASAVFAAPASDGSALPSFIAASQAAQPILEPPAQTMPKPTGAAASLPTMPDAVTATATTRSPPSTVDRTISAQATQPSAVATPPTDSTVAPVAKTSRVAAAEPVSRTAPIRELSPAATSTAATLPAAPSSEPLPAPTDSAPDHTPTTPAGDGATSTRDKTAALTLQADAPRPASAAPQTPLAAPAPQADTHDAGFAPRQPDKDTQIAATADASAILGTVAATATASGTPAAQPTAAGTPPAPTQAPPPAAQLASAVANLQVGADGTSHVTIRLDPAELGHVQIRISRATDGTTSVDVAVERPDTLATLQNDLGHLHQALDRAGLPDQRSVTMHLAAQPDQGGSTGSSANTGSGNGFTPQGGFQQGARQQHQATSQAPAATMPDSTSIPLPPRPATIAGSGVNITA